MSATPPEQGDESLDERAFEAALTFLFGEAHEEGVERNWSCTTNEDLPDWEVQVFEVPSVTEDEAAIEEHR